MPLTLTSSFKALLDDGQASAELSALREKVATLSEVSSAQAAFFQQSSSSQQREIDELRRQAQLKAKEHGGGWLTSSKANEQLRECQLAAQKNVEAVRQQAELEKQALEASIAEQAQTIEGCANADPRLLSSWMSQSQPPSLLTQVCGGG